ncbi:MAG: DUF6285 domain-containing protein [Planctomycetes bacterium]|nr:DUF6285 domain-containing protein [Planctomycetota bacterium]
MSAPDPTDLLAAVARFLDEDARPALGDPALAFRARIGAALLRSLAAEAGAAEALEAADLARLRAVLAALDGREDHDEGADLTTPSESERRAALRTVERALCDRVRAGLAPGDLARVRAAVAEGLRARLAVTTPAFDLSPEVE